MIMLIERKTVRVYRESLSSMNTQRELGGSSYETRENISTNLERTSRNNTTPVSDPNN